MASEKWNPGEDIPVGANCKLQKTTREDNKGAGTRASPLVYWDCPMPNVNDPSLQRRVIDSVYAFTEAWARRCGFELVWVRASPHETKGMYNEYEEFLLEFESKLKGTTQRKQEEKRYDAADCHITIRAGRWDQENKSSKKKSRHQGQRCQVSGHLYVSLDQEGVVEGPMKTTERKHIVDGDYRVEELWVWFHPSDKKKVVADVKEFLITPRYDSTRLHSKRRLPEDDYGCQNNPCKRRRLDKEACETSAGCLDLRPGSMTKRLMLYYTQKQKQKANEVGELQGKHAHPRPAKDQKWAVAIIPDHWDTYLGLLSHTLGKHDK